MTRVQKFVIGFIVLNFLAVFLILSRYDIDKPLPVPVRFVPLSLFVLAIVTVAVMARTPQTYNAAPQSTGSRATWAVKVLTIVYCISLAGAVALVGFGVLRLRLALLGIALNAAVLGVLMWFIRSAGSRR